MSNKKRHISVIIPVSLAREVDSFIGKYGYSSRAEIVKDAISGETKISW